ncbi:hypothetical protein [uncultured Bradyrhizobium sp.]|uniref:hypothetical protein n=1 Tax=uncultured Bradyrhizobium sp. TaxID=199684 RepID=UPI0035CB09FC
MKNKDTPINETDVAGKIGGYFGVMGSDPRITQLLAKIFPEVKLASSGDPAGWHSAFLGVMAKYEGLAKELGLGVSQTQRDLETLRTSNRTDASFAGAAGRLGQQGLRHYAAIHAGSDERDSGASRGTVSSAAYARETPLTVAGAVGFAKELGISPAHAAFFEGGSSEMRNAIRDAIRSDKAISDDKIKDMRDVSMVIGAIRSGKIKEDDPKVPDSVKKVIKQMREEGVDPVKGDSKTVKKYLDDHPEKLNAVKREAASKEQATLGNASLDQSKTKGTSEADTAIAAAQKKQKNAGSKKPAAPTVSATL